MFTSNHLLKFVTFQCVLLHWVVADYCHKCGALSYSYVRLMAWIFMACDV